MSIKVTFEFETADEAVAFIADNASDAAKPAGAKRGRAARAAAEPAASPAAPAAAAQEVKTVAAAPVAVPFKDVADAITALADKSLDTAKSVLAQFGVAKASDLKPEQFGAVVAAAKASLAPAAGTSLI